ncbi:hypothetical protein RUND412_004959, partial [Rhizina undulata]
MASIPKILIGALSALLTTTLDQIITNGNSNLGTLNAPDIPQYLTNNPLPQGKPWGALTASNANPYHDAPYTGVTRYYDFTITKKTLYPDGVYKEMIVANNQFPGPLIEANWGDWIEVEVHNDMTDEGTALHWHGLLQTATPWLDGVPSVQQCPIAPGSSLTYRFRADIYGTSWWHSHYSGQYASGLLGPMIIHGPSHLTDAQNYDIDLGPVFITDAYHRPYTELVEDVMSTDITTVLAAGVSDNNLINGKMAYNCSLITDGTQCKDNAGISKFKFTTGKKHLLRLINAGAEGLQRFSVDGHELLVIAVDFVPIQPYTTTIVELGIGQRMDVIVTANQKADSSYWMRSVIQTDCSSSNQPTALAAIYYPRANQKRLPKSTPVEDTIGSCATSCGGPLNKTIPFYPITPPAVPDTTVVIELNTTTNATGHHLWTMNNSSFRANFNNPILLLSKLGNNSYPAEWNVINTNQSTSIRVVLNNRSAAQHPMHLHGHNMYILSEGDGDWDGTIVNPENPTRRDTQIVRANGHLVFQFDGDNPGAWAFHCHIAWHVSGGLYVNFLERPDDIRSMAIPQTMAQTCRDWAAWT